MTHVFSAGIQTLVAVLLVLAGLLAPPVNAASQKKPPAAEPGSGKVGKVTFREAPSHESAAAREKRLRRECRGRPNAGACLGHTR